jgi:putative oxidoreductase
MESTRTPTKNGGPSLVTGAPSRLGQRIVELLDSDAVPNEAREVGGFAASTGFLVPAGRFLYALIFITAFIGNLSQGTISYAAQQGVPMAGLLVPLSGVIALAGGLSVLLGYRARIGAGLLVLFLVPVTLMMHRFWAIEDPLMARLEQVMFMKNLSMLGGALLIAHFGAGPHSLDARTRRKGP